MPSKVRAIVFHQYGAPAEVARCVEIETAEPAADEVRVRLLAAPINPADLNVIEGKYPIRPALPGVPSAILAARVGVDGGDATTWQWDRCSLAYCTPQTFWSTAKACGSCCASSARLKGKKSLRTK